MSRADSLADALRRSEVEDFEATSNFASCLLPLLTSLGWHGDTRELMEALPHFASRLDLIDLRNALAELGYLSRRNQGRLRDIDSRLMPCVFLARGRAPLVVHARSDKGFIVFDSAVGQVREIRGWALTGYYYTFERQGRAQPANDGRSWTWQLFRRFRSEALIVLACSLFSAVFGIAVPVFVIAVYDIVVPAASDASLAWLVPGLAAALIIDFLTRNLRAKALAHMAGRLDYLIGTETFRRLLELPPATSDNHAIGAQLQRLKGFQSVRDVVNSPIANMILELPLVLMALLVIGYVGGMIVLIPIGALTISTVMAVIFVPAIRRAEADAARARAQRDQLVTELVSNQRSLRETVMEDSFIDRLRPLSAQTATDRSRASQRMIVLQSVCHGLVMGAGLLTVVFGANQVIAQEMSTGSLVASMALVWRVLTPIQLGFQALPRMSQIGQTLTQINRLMRTPPETFSVDTLVDEHRFNGKLSARRISMRYRDDADPALLAISFDVEPGELVALTGPSGAGKSTALKVLAGLLRPQAGSVFYGGVEQRHIELTALRRSVAFLPQTPRLFYGTVAQNLRLANPSATDDMMRAAAEAAGVLEEIEALEDGFNTWIGDEKLASLPESFRQKLSLARVWIKDAPIILLDEPAQNLDTAGDARLMRHLTSLKGQKTVIFVTHRPSAVRMADRVVTLDSGRLRPEERERKPAPKKLQTGAD